MESKLHFINRQNIFRNWCTQQRFPPKICRENIVYKWPAQVWTARRFKIGIEKYFYTSWGWTLLLSQSGFSILRFIWNINTHQITKFLETRFTATTTQKDSYVLRSTQHLICHRNSRLGFVTVINITFRLIVTKVDSHYNQNHINVLKDFLCCYWL